MKFFEELSLFLFQLYEDSTSSHVIFVSMIMSIPFLMGMLAYIWMRFETRKDVAIEIPAIDIHED